MEPQVQNAAVAASRPAQVSLQAHMEKMACVSTGHLPKHTADALGNDQGKSGEPALWNVLSYVFFHEYGWIVHASVDAAEAVRELHPELAYLLEQCLQNGAAYLRLDCDGLAIDGLATFDW